MGTLINLLSPRYNHYRTDYRNAMELYTECCEAHPLGYVEEFGGDLFGICCQCKEWSVLYQETDNDQVDWSDELEYIKEHE